MKKIIYLFVCLIGFIILSCDLNGGIKAKEKDNIERILPKPIKIKEKFEEYIKSFLQVKRDYYDAVNYITGCRRLEGLLKKDEEIDLDDIENVLSLEEKTFVHYPKFVSLLNDFNSFLFEDEDLSKKEIPVERFKKEFERIYIFSDEIFSRNAENSFYRVKDALSSAKNLPKGEKMQQIENRIKEFYDYYKSRTYMLKSVSMALLQELNDLTR